MNQATSHALNAINLAFYREQAEAFSASREYPWPGWQRLLTHLPRAAQPLRVLELGCGNGRFARFLSEHCGARNPGLEYCGVDASPPLLARARQRDWAGTRTRWQQLDFVAQPDALPAGPFDLVALLGVLHGVPGRASRRALLRTAAARLAPAGLLVFTCWRFGELARFRGRLLSWETYNRAAPHPIDPSELEPGDHLLPWGRDGRSLRYCHASDAAEREALVEGLSLICADRFLADGRSGDLNHYAVYRAAPNTPPR
jgi:tRNA (uracil-5-)-methyltransferase TRM9